MTMASQSQPQQQQQQSQQKKPLFSYSSAAKQATSKDTLSATSSGSPVSPVEKQQQQQQTSGRSAGKSGNNNRISTSPVRGGGLVSAVSPSGNGFDGKGKPAQPPVSLASSTASSNTTATNVNSVVSPTPSAAQVIPQPQLVDAPPPTKNAWAKLPKPQTPAVVPVSNPQQNQLQHQQNRDHHQQTQQHGGQFGGQQQQQFQGQQQHNQNQGQHYNNNNNRNQGGSHPNQYQQGGYNQQQQQFRGSDQHQNQNQQQQFRGGEHQPQQYQKKRPVSGAGPAAANQPQQNGIDQRQPQPQHVPQQHAGGGEMQPLQQQPHQRQQYQPQHHQHQQQAFMPNGAANFGYPQQFANVPYGPPMPFNMQPFPGYNAMAPPFGMQPQQQQSQPTAFTQPAKRAIKIINPISKEEVVLPKAASVRITAPVVAGASVAAPVVKGAAPVTGVSPSTPAAGTGETSVKKPIVFKNPLTGEILNLASKFAPVVKAVIVPEVEKKANEVPRPASPGKAPGSPEKAATATPARPASPVKAASTGAVVAPVSPAKTLVEVKRSASPVKAAVVPVQQAPAERARSRSPEKKVEAPAAVVAPVAPVTAVPSKERASSRSPERKSDNHAVEVPASVRPKSPERHAPSHTTAPPPGLSAAVDHDAGKPPAPASSNVSMHAAPVKKVVTAALEEGELPANVISATLPLLTAFVGLKYPSSIQPHDLPMEQDGTIKYSIDFMSAMGKALEGEHPRTAGMMAWKNIYGNEQPIVRSPNSYNDNRGGSNGARMMRQGSESGSSSGRGGSSRGRGSVMPPQTSRGGGRGGQSGGVQYGHHQQDRGVPMNRQQSSSDSRGGSRRGPNVPAPVVPALVKGENAWGAKKVDLSASEASLKYIKGLLNKLTLDNFEKLLGKILDSDIPDEETLRGAITLISEKAIDEPHFASIYATLCLRLYNELPEVHGWVNPTGNTQDNIFRKLLLRRCQDEFEKDSKWADEDAAAQVERAELRKRIEDLSQEEKQKIAEEDYSRIKLKRRVLGNIHFVGQLFLQGLISESIIHRCIQNLLKDVETPEEEDIESLCKLLTSTGQRIDNAKAADTMELYFERLRMLSVNTESLSSRIRFLVMDLIDLREKHKWQNANVNQAKSLAQVKKEIEDEEREKERAKRGGSGGKHGGPRITKTGSSSGNQNNRPDREDRRASKANESEGGWNSVSTSDRRNDNSRSSRGRGGNNPPMVQASAPVITKSRNTFAALEMSEGPVAVKSPTTAITPTLTQMDSMNKAFKNFMITLDADEFLEDIVSVEDDPVVEKLVLNIVQFVLDKNGSNKRQLVNLLHVLFFEQDSRFNDSQELFVSAFNSFFKAFDDDRADFPKGFLNASLLLSPLLENNFINIDNLLEITQPISSYPGRKSVLPDFLADFLLASEDTPLNYIIKTNFDLKPFFPLSDDQGTVIEVWIKSKGLEDIAVLNNVISSSYAASSHEKSKANTFRYLSKEEVEQFNRHEDSSFKEAYGKALLEVFTKKHVFEDNYENDPQPQSRSLFIHLKAQIDHFQSLVKFYENPVDLLIATETFCTNHGIEDLLVDLYRIYRDLSLVLKEGFIEFKDVAKYDSDDTAKWFLSLEDSS